jgi:branched-chain amino acid transport system substrate-binding protein
MKIKGLFLLITALSLIPGLPSSARGAEKPEPAVRIGVYLPMTGPLAAQGQAEYAGIEIAHKMRPTVLGRNVELFLVDTAREGVGTDGAVTRLIKEEKVHALIGEPVGTDTLAGITIAEKFEKPIVVPASSHPSATQEKRYTFRVGLTNSLQGEIAARYASLKLKARKAAIIMGIDQNCSTDLATIFMKHFAAMGRKVVSIAYCRTGDTVFTTQLSSTVTAKPDVLYLPLSYPQVSLICRQSVGMGLNAHIISSRNTHTPELIKEGGEAVEGVILPDDFDRKGFLTDIAAAYIDRYEKETGGQAGRFDVLGADAYLLLMDAFQRADSTAGSKVRQALATTKEFEGISGIMDMDQEGNAIKSILILQIKKGDFQYLESLSPRKEMEQQP